MGTPPSASREALEPVEPASPHARSVPVAVEPTSPVERLCANCGSPAPEAYCPRCGQETRLALPSAPGFLRDAAGRYLPLDGRFWRTMLALLFRPGFLTSEYLAGRRRRYIRPARLYLVLSIALFALLRLMVAPLDVERTVERDPVVVPDAGSTGHETARIKGLVPGVEFTFDDKLNVQVDAGDESWIGPLLKRRLERFNRLPLDERAERMVVGALQYGPYAMFALLPAFALLLKLLYLGPRRRHTRRPSLYAEHLVFAAHQHAFLFVALALALLLPYGPAGLAILAAGVAYGLVSMRRVYGVGWLGAMARGLVLAACYIPMFATVTVALMLAAIVLR